MRHSINDAKCGTRMGWLFCSDVIGVSDVCVCVLCTKHVADYIVPYIETGTGRKEGKIGYSTLLHLQFGSVFLTCNCSMKLGVVVCGSQSYMTLRISISP